MQPGAWAGCWEGPEGLRYWYCKAYVGAGMGRQIRTGRCKRHRGPVKGPTNPRWKDGRYAQVPVHLEAAVLASLADENQLALAMDIALVDGRQDELLGELGEGVGAWDAACQAEVVMTRARGRGDADGLGEAWDQLRDALAKGKAYQTAWAELYRTMDLRRRLVATEAQRIATAQEMVDRAQLAVMVERIGRAMVEALEATVTDAKERLAAREAASALIRGYLEA